MNHILRAPARAYSPEELREVLSSGLMSFPLTDFDAAGEFHEKGYRDRLDWLMPYGATRFENGQNMGAAPVSTQVQGGDIKVVFPEAFADAKPKFPANA